MKATISNPCPGCAVLVLITVTSVLAVSTTAAADSSALDLVPGQPGPVGRASEQVDDARRGHGPTSRSFPSHRLQWAAHSQDRPQLGINVGLVQPLLRGFNVASDLRVGKFVFEYSHGMNLDYNALSAAMDPADRDVGLDLDSPWTTGGGVGYVLFDELHAMVEFKAHRYEVALGDARADYTTVSIGPALVWRYFLYRGFHANFYLRYWPNVWTSTDGDTVVLQDGATRHEHEVTDLGFFANISLGYAFDL